MTGEALLELGQAAAQLGLAHLDARGAHFEACAQRADRGDPLFEALTRRTQSLETFGTRGLFGFEGGEDVVELRDPGALAPDALGQLVEVDAYGVALDGHIALFGVETAQGVGRGGESAVVLVETPHRVGGSRGGRVELGRCLCGVGRGCG